MSLREEMYSAGNTVNDVVIFFFFLAMLHGLQD